MPKVAWESKEPQLQLPCHGRCAAIDTRWKQFDPAGKRASIFRIKKCRAAQDATDKTRLLMGVERFLRRIAGIAGLKSPRRRARLAPGPEKT
jgi:hypothetical protein